MFNRVVVKSLLLLSCFLSATACSTLQGIIDDQPSPVGRTAVVPLQAGDSYYDAAHAAIDARIDARMPQKAKNAIIFIGDGMGISSITAARILAGQMQGLDGESYTLAMDTMPWSALSKTYSHDAQIPDSAATATAMISGVKTGARTLGLMQTVKYGNCASSEGAETQSLFVLAEKQGLSTGIVSTARITHATPASAYAMSASRNWEDNTSIKGAADDCPDIARQLIEWDHGDGFEVVMGGGRRHFMTEDQVDPEYADKFGRRTDGRDLVKEWTAKSDTHVYAYDQAGFETLDFESDARVLALFEPSHMNYEIDRAGDGEGEPSLAELTEAAIKRLSLDEEGFLLMVEGGRVDHGHHAGNAARALGDAVALDNAVAKALEMTSSDDTLIIVTADHSHTMTIAGYSRRNNPILGLSSYGIQPNKAADGKTYTTLGYANGPGAVCPEDAEECGRGNPTQTEALDKNYVQQSRVPLGSETHGGEDVAILARGPGANLVSGVMEQHEIFQVMARSLNLVE